MLRKKTVIGKASKNQVSVNQTFANQVTVPIGVELAHDHHVFIAPDTTTCQEVEITLGGQKLSAMSRELNVQAQYFRQFLILNS